VCDVVGELDRHGVRIHYDIAGRGPTVLATHGFASSSHAYAPVVPALSARHRVVTWDLRGHAGSDSPDDVSVYSVSASVGDMLALLDATETERAVLMGHSLGGFLSLELERTHRDRVAALVLVGTGPGFRNPTARDDWNAMAGRFADVLETKGIAGLRVGEEVRADVHRSAAGLAHAARGILCQRDASVLEHLPDIHVPVLVIVGENDANFLRGSQYLADKIPGAQRVEIAGAGHAPMLTHADAFSAAVLPFLEQVA